MDRPSRKTKSVNYCESKDFDDEDDDFTCAMAPPSKKPREGVKQHEEQKSSSKPSSQESSSQSSLSQKSRKPLDEKLFDRDLEAAITLSSLNNVDGIKELSPSSTDAVNLPADENTDPLSLHRSNCSVDASLLGLDEITSDKDALTLPRQRKSASKAEVKTKNLQDEDKDYEPKPTPDSESDEDFSEPAESEDEEFTLKKIKKTKKEKATKSERTKKPPVLKKEKQQSKPSKSKSQPAASTPVRSPPAARLAAKRPASSATVSTSKPAVSVSPAGGRIPKWTPPGQIGKSPSSTQGPGVKSPGQGLRLGLSRLVRVKPLHPSVASH
ncbi:RAD51-associated protein 1 [Aulostomus maculatus]